MKEGTVVVVVANTEESIHETSGSDGTKVGTVIGFTKDSIMVLLSNGLIWMGSKREVVLHELLQ